MNRNPFDNRQTYMYSIATTFSSTCFKTFVTVPCLVLFVAISILSYQAGGIGNLYTSTIENSGYNSATKSYRICADELPQPEMVVPTQKDIDLGFLSRDAAEGKIKPKPDSSIVCNKYKQASSSLTASLISHQLSGAYIIIVLVYLIILFIKKRLF